jgi:hypothetical protein
MLISYRYCTFGQLTVCVSLSVGTPAAAGEVPTLRLASGRAGRWSSTKKSLL